MVVPPASIDATGVLENDTAIGGTTMGRITLLLAEGSLVAVAVIATVVPMGMVEGEVNMDGEPSGVCVGENVPQAPPVVLPFTGLPPQVTVQSTPSFAGSFTGVMLTCALALIASDCNCPETTPVGSVTEIVPAFVEELELQPDAIISSAVQNAKTAMRAPAANANPDENALRAFPPKTTA